MSDSGNNGIQGAVEEMAQATGEVAKDVKDSVGEMIETNVQTAVGTPPTPQQIQQKQAEDQQKITETRRKISWFKKIDQEQRRVIQENKQKEMQRLQSLQQEKQVKQIKLEQKKAQPINPALAMMGKPEKKGGVGG